MTAFFSVVVPAYNSAWCLGVALRSVLEQSFREIEVIVVDDGSTDETAEVVARFADPRVRYVRQENAGRAAARNAGIAQARGDWIAFLDADDMWLPGKLERQHAFLAANSGVVMLYGQVSEFVRRDMRTGEPDMASVTRTRGYGEPGVADRLAPFLLGEVEVNTSSVVARKDALEGIGGFDSLHWIVEDWDLFVRLAARGPVGYEPGPIALYWKGPFKNEVERARKYNWHRDFVAMANKNAPLLLGKPDGARLAARARAKWHWTAAIMESALGRAAEARKLVQTATGIDPSFAGSRACAVALAESVLDAVGREASDETVRHEVSARANALLPSAIASRVERKALAYVLEDRAFSDYQAGQLARGLRHAIAAARNDTGAFGNRGLWTTPARRALRRLRGGA